MHGHDTLLLFLTFIFFRIGLKATSGKTAAPAILLTEIHHGNQFHANIPVLLQLLVLGKKEKNEMTGMF